MQAVFRVPAALWVVSLPDYHVAALWHPLDDSSGIRKYLFMLGLDDKLCTAD